MALLLVFMTFVLARNLPGLLEISLFRRWETGPGERYAVASIAKYAITLLGGVLAFNAIGIGWSNVQWLVAAVGLGLGFGLQEIFANFVSGLILLFERPIRVGDTVTVDNRNGTVSKIRIRATVITTFDRKELVVPNKEFVTKQVINWSLSDTVLRVDIPVGIAYGADVDAALAKLIEVAHAHEHVLEDPKPRALFLGFAADRMNLELRVFSPDVEHTLSIRHDLHVAIERAFREAEIPFPPQSPPLRAPAPNPPPASDRANDSRVMPQAVYPPSDDLGTLRVSSQLLTVAGAGRLSEGTNAETMRMRMAREGLAPRNTGGRRSAIAATPSRKSAVSWRRSCSARSRLVAARISAASPPRWVSRIEAIASGPDAAISAANARASSRTRASGTSRSTRPIASARSPSIRAPV